MKKVLLLVLAVAMVLPMAACGSSEYELALITDAGTIDDKSFNQGSWEGLKEYAEEHNISYKYYQPAEVTDVAYLDSIALAVEAGAKVVVTPGYLFEETIYVAQDEYPEVKFIILDGSPHDGDYNVRVEDNVYSVFYAEEEAGFLAGYAAVKEGFTELGYMGGMAVPAVVRFGFGYLQGAEYAAAEMGVDSINVNYHYTGSFDATPEAQSMAASWYNNSGIEVIFACGGSVGNSVMAAAEGADGYVIGVDVDQSDESETVITSSMKELGISVYDAIDAYYNDSFPGGEIATLDVTVDGVGLPMDTSRFDNFTEQDYDAIYQELVNGSVDIFQDTEDTSPHSVPGLEIVEIEFHD